MPNNDDFKGVFVIFCDVLTCEVNYNDTEIIEKPTPDFREPLMKLWFPSNMHFKANGFGLRWSLFWARKM